MSQHLDTPWADTDRVETQTSNRPDGSRVTTRRNLETGVVHVHDADTGQRLSSVPDLYRALTGEELSR